MLFEKLKWVTPVIVAMGIGILGSSGHSSEAVADEPEPQHTGDSRWAAIEAEIQELAHTTVVLRRAGESEAAYKVSQRLTDRLKGWQDMLQAEHKPATKPISEGDKRQARELLQIAHNLMLEGKLDQAAQKIAEAHRLGVSKWGKFDVTPDLLADQLKRLEASKKDATRSAVDAADAWKLALSRRLSEGSEVKSQEKRLQDVEQKLDRILKALEKTDTPKAKPAGN